MPTDFYAVARRHRQVAGILLAAQRLANASQLFGLEAEYGLA